MIRRNSNDNNKGKSSRKKALAKLGLAAAVIYVAPMLMNLSQANASCGGRPSGALQVASEPTTVAECGECHMPYGPKYLTTDAWTSIMNNLSDHFGEDASGLDQETINTITAYLDDGSAWGSGGPLRITETPRFYGKHGNCFTPDKPAWKCESCHRTGGSWFN